MSQATMAEAATAVESAAPAPLSEVPAAAPDPGAPGEVRPPAAPVDEPLAAAMPESISSKVSADDVVAVESPSIAPVDLDADGPVLDAAATHDAVPAEDPSEDIESVAARRLRAGTKRQKRGWPLSGLQSAILALVIIILVVEGSIINKAGRMIDVPRLRFAVRNAAREEIYSWTAVPPRAALPPGEAVSFRIRLASPPPDAHDVLVRFVNRFDVLSGNH